MTSRWFFLTVAGSGLLPKAPGTWGSLLSLFLALPIMVYLDIQTLFMAAILITLIAIKVINKHEAEVKTHDDSRIVIDELAGMWIALAIGPGVSFTWSDLLILENGILLQIILSFTFFRIYDIKKPSVIGRLDREAPGGLGVMLDDVVAGFAAGITTAIVWQIILKFIA